MIVTAKMTSTDASRTLERILDVTSIISREIDRLENPDWDWRVTLPSWFVDQFAEELTAEEAEEALRRYRNMSNDERVTLASTQRWAPRDWLFWMTAENATWRLSQGRLIDDHRLEVDLEIDGWPTALGAFNWLARAAGAEKIVIE